MRKLIVALLIIFALYKTYEAHTYKHKVEVLTERVFELVEKNMDNTFK